MLWDALRFQAPSPLTLCSTTTHCPVIFLINSELQWARRDDWNYRKNIETENHLPVELIVSSAHFRSFLSCLYPRSCKVITFRNLRKRRLSKRFLCRLLVAVREQAMVSPSLCSFYSPGSFPFLPQIMQLTNCIFRDNIMILIDTINFLHK